MLGDSDTGEHRPTGFGGGTLEVQEGVALEHGTSHSLVSVLAESDVAGHSVELAAELSVPVLVEMGSYSRSPQHS